MRALVTTLILSLGAVAGLPAESRATQAMLGCPATAQAGQQFTIEVTVDVSPSCTMDSQCGAKYCTAPPTVAGQACTMDADCPGGGAGSCLPFCNSTSHTCNTPLGGYTVVLTYDPTVVTVASVSGGSTPAFAGTPTNSTTCPTANSCQTTLSAFQTSSLAGPTGVISVAMVTFNAVAAASPASIDLAIKPDTRGFPELFNTNSAPICMPQGAQTCSVMGCGLSITPGATTTTTTRPSTTTTSTSSTSTTRRTTTTTTTSSSTTTRPTASLPTATTTTTTTQPCTSARCILNAVLTNPACAGEAVPASVTKKFDQAASLIEQAASSSGKQTRKLLKKAKKALKQGEAKATRAAKGKHAKISSNCAVALKGAADGVLAGLGV